MKKLFTVLMACFVLGGYVNAQQDAMFTKYMFNSLVFNPGYAGSSEFLSVGVLHRSQWVGIDGAPVTQSVTAHTPLKNDRVGVGLSLINDQIGPTNNLGANLSYAYRIPLGDNAKLSIGLQAGVENYRADFTGVDIQNPDDEAFENNMNVWLPNFGGGIYYYSKYFYAGLGVPHLIENDLRPGNSITTGIYARQVRHYYFHSGLALPLKGDALIFKPSVLVKTLGLIPSKDTNFQDIGAPHEFDIDLSLLFQETLWIGASFRSAFNAFGEEKTSSFDSADLWMSYLLSNGMRIGVAYDYSLQGLQNYSDGSFELFVGWDFKINEKEIVTPR